MCIPAEHDCKEQVKRREDHTESGLIMLLTRFVLN